MIIKNVLIYTKDQSFVAGSVKVNGKVIEEIMLGGDIEAGEEEVIDGEEAYCIPGMIDIHFHGCMGDDFCDGTREALEVIAQYEASIGVTAICPATMTLAVEELEDILACAAAYKKEQEAGSLDMTKRADLIGVNMEGPFISPVKKGAQAEQFMMPCNVDVYRRFQKAADGLVKFIAIAPEEASKEEVKHFIDSIKDEVTVSLAHTNAGYDDANYAFSQGAAHAVHFYNAMPTYTHRDPGVIGAAFDNKHVNAEIICDGVHIHPTAVRVAFSLLGEDRMILISDSMRAAGMPDGEYTLGGQAVHVEGNVATMVSDGALAGSVTTLPDCVRYAVKHMDIPLETAIACATIHPAKSLKLDHIYGSIEEGKKADLALWNKDLSLKCVIKDGAILA